MVLDAAGGSPHAREESQVPIQWRFGALAVLGDAKAAHAAKTPIGEGQDPGDMNRI